MFDSESSSKNKRVQSKRKNELVKSGIFLSVLWYFRFINSTVSMT